MQCLLFLSNSTPTTAPLKKSVFHNGAPLKNRRLFKSLFFLSLSSGAAPYERGGRRSLPQVLTAEIFPAPWPLRRHRLQAGQLMWPSTPSVHGVCSLKSASQGGGQQGWGQVIGYHHFLLVRESLWLHKVPDVGAHDWNKHWQIGHIDWWCVSVKWQMCSKSCAHTYSDLKKERKKSRGLHFKGQSHSGFKMSFHISGTICVFSCLSLFIYKYSFNNSMNPQ